jgi:uncharacterized BrkB/YihY/UPF0761 family membrane protein
VDAVLTWIWLSVVIVLLGAELNAEMEHQTAVLHGSVGGRTEPAPRLCLSNADGLRASKLKHAVQGSNGDGHLRQATPIRP